MKSPMRYSCLVASVGIDDGDRLLRHSCEMDGNAISGGGEGFGRGTHYIQWGQGNLRFATMRLRGEKDEKRKMRKVIIKIFKI